MSSHDFDRIEEGFAELLAGSLPFSPSESDEIKHFLDVGEYGIALETLIDIINEEGKSISRRALGLIGELALQMELLDEFESAGLDKRVFE